VDTAVAMHVSGHDPRDVIADCDFKLEIIDLHEPVMLRRMVDGQMRDVAACGYDTDPDSAGWVDFPCEMLRLLAKRYRHRDGYDERWTA
jgi:hypothetical protein